MWIGDVVFPLKSPKNRIKPQTDYEVKAINKGKQLLKVQCLINAPSRLLVQQQRHSNIVQVLVKHRTTAHLQRLFVLAPVLRTSQSHGYRGTQARECTVASYTHLCVPEASATTHWFSGLQTHTHFTHFSLTQIHQMFMQKEKPHEYTSECEGHGDLQLMPGKCF